MTRLSRNPLLPLQFIVLVQPLRWGPRWADSVAARLRRAHAAEVRGDTELALRLTQSAIVADPALPGRTWRSAISTPRGSLTQARFRA